MYDQEEDLHNELLELLESHILSAFEDIDSREKMTGFDKWLKLETNKIKGLEDELKKIKDSVPQEDLRSMFNKLPEDYSKQSLKPKKKGRTRKS